MQGPKISMKSLDEYNRGNLAAYIELLKTGIRGICLPNISSCKECALDHVDKEASVSGLSSLLVTYKGIRRVAGRRRNLYQRIVYRRGKKAGAEQLRRRLEKNPKNKADERVIGELLGYSENAIDLFINAR
jgi:uncharacterized protein (DUF2342 family)